MELWPDWENLFTPLHSYSYMYQNTAVLILIFVNSKGNKDQQGKSQSSRN